MSGAAPTYRLRWQFRTSKNFNVEAAELGFDLAGRPATLRSLNESPLSQSEWVAMHVGGFPNATEAREFGLRLQRAAALACTKTDLGIDMGDNSAPSRISDTLRQAILNDS